MPHDINNQEIKVGDLVFVECVVTAVHATDNNEFCNVNLDTVRPMPPYTEPMHLTLNTKQVELFEVEEPETAEFRDSIEALMAAGKRLLVAVSRAMPVTSCWPTTGKKAE